MCVHCHYRCIVHTVCSLCLKLYMHTHNGNHVPCHTAPPFHLESDDGEDEESSGEELDKEEVMKYLKAKGLFNGGAGDDDEGDSEDDEEGEDDDEDEEDDEEEDEEEEEMEQAPVPKKKQVSSSSCCRRGHCLKIPAHLTSLGDTEQSRSRTSAIIAMV